MPRDPPSWPTLHSEALSGFAGEIVRAATENSEADPVAVLGTLLAHAAITVGRGPRFRLADAWHHPRLFVALVGQSARGRKGTSEAPIKRLNDIVEQTLPPLAWKPGPLSSGEGITYAVRDESEDGDPGVADKRLFIVDGEMGAMFRAMQRNGNTLSTILRSAWDGRTLAPLTKGNRITATDPHVGIVAHITQTELAELITRSDLHNGFANRFLWLAVRRSKSMPLARGMSDGDVARLGSEYARRLRFARELGEIEFSVEAEAAYRMFYEEIGRERSGPHGLVTSRADAQTVRLALTYAMLDASPIITLDHLQSALAIVEYADDSALYVFGDATSNALERRILDALGNGPKSTTDLHKALGNHTDAKALKAGLQTLEGSGRITGTQRPTGGRSACIWSLPASVNGSQRDARNAN